MDWFDWITRPLPTKHLGRGITAVSLVSGILCAVSPAARSANVQQLPFPSVVQPGAPGTPSKQLPPSTSALAPLASPADIAFMQGMITHHAQAVAITALIPSHTENEDIHTLGARISLSQTGEMKFMQRWLHTHGAPLSMAIPGMPAMARNGKPMAAMPGMLTAEQMNALRQANGAAFDRLFLTGMMQHHEGALVMVKQLFDIPGAGQDADLFDFATDVDTTQRAEISIMENMVQENR